MKNENISSNKLDDYFALARDMQPVTGVEEMERRIVNAKMDSKSFFHTSKFKIVMSTSIIVIAAYITSLFLTYENKQTTTSQPTSTNQLMIEKGYKAGNPQMNLSNNTKTFSSFSLNQSTPGEPVLTTPESADANNILSYLPGVVPLTLDKAHLKKLGFEVGENGKGIMYTTGIDGLGTMSYSNDVSGCNLKINSTGFILNKIRDYYPVLISDGTSITPLDIDAELRKENKFMFRDSQINWNLVPVIIKQSEYGKLEGYKDAIFWFKSTPDLQKILDDEKLTGANLLKLSKLDSAINDLKSSYVPCTSTSNIPVEPEKAIEAVKRTSSGLPDVKPIELSKSQLEDIGFNFRKGKVDYQTHVIGMGDIAYKVLWNGSDARVNNIGLILKSRDYYPVYINEIGKNDVENIDSFLKSGHKEYIQGTNRLEYSNYVEEFHLIPVRIKRPASTEANADSYKDLIFWFKVTPSLIKVINNKDLSDNAAVVVKHSDITAEAYNSQRADAKAQITNTINGIKSLELTKDQLHKLGFTVGEFGVKYACNIKQSDGQMEITDDSIEKHHERIILNGNGSFEFSTAIGGGYNLRIDGKTIKQVGYTQDFYPVFISDNNGIQAIKYRFGNFESDKKWTDEYFLSQIRKLVPVLVGRDIQGLSYKKDLIFWFNVTPSFLALLPDTVSHEMGNEYKKLTEKNGDQDTTTVTCKYFDVCQLPLEKELKVNIYPNPAQLLLNVDFELSGNTTASVYMCDLGGKIVKSSDQTYSGSQHVQIQTGDLKSGIYLVILKMSNGAVLTNKVVIASKD